MKNRQFGSLHCSTAFERSIHRFRSTFRKPRNDKRDCSTPPHLYKLHSNDFTPVRVSENNNGFFQRKSSARKTVKKESTHLEPVNLASLEVSRGRSASFRDSRSRDPVRLLIMTSKKIRSTSCHGPRNATNSNQNEISNTSKKVVKN